jgi:hypothetical protein
MLLAVFISEFGDRETSAAPDNRVSQVVSRMPRSLIQSRHHRQTLEISSQPNLPGYRTGRIISAIFDHQAAQGFDHAIEGIDATPHIRAIEPRDVGGKLPI